MPVGVRQLHGLVEQLARQLARPGANGGARGADPQLIERCELLGLLTLAVMSVNPLCTLWTDKRAAFLAMKPKDERAGAGDATA
jgi:hypothetical protein